MADYSSIRNEEHRESYRQACIYSLWKGVYMHQVSQHRKDENLHALGLVAADKAVEAFLARFPPPDETT